MHLILYKDRKAKKKEDWW